VQRFWISGGQIDNGAIYFARAIVAVERYMSPQVFNDAPRYANSFAHGMAPMPIF
jgi:hypothetical protein